MEILLKNRYVIVVIVAALTYSVCMIIKFVKEPTDKKIANVKEWLRYAVSIAEKKLGGGTGQLKLRMVYDMAIEKFPWIASIVPFDTFKEWVDDALVWLKGELEKNSQIKAVIDSGDN